MTPDRYTRLKELFIRVVDLDQEARDEVLDSECADDPELRDKVVALLQHDDPRTLIRSGHSTVADFSPIKLTVPRRRTMVGRLRSIGGIMDRLGPRGLLALGGLLSSVLLALMGYFGHHTIRHFQKELRREALNEIVDGKVLGLRMWLEHETEKVESWARSEKMRRLVSQLVLISDDKNDLSDSFLDDLIHQQIRAEVTTLAGRKEHYAIWDRRFRLISDSVSAENRIGQGATPWGASVLASVFDGRSMLFSFNKKRSITHLDKSANVSGHLAIVTPIRDDEDNIVAAIQVHDTKSREKSSRLLKTLRLGGSGETYVFSEDGVMLSASRFDKQLKEFHLVPDASDAESDQSFYVRDPGGDVTTGYKVTEPMSSRPLTKMVRLCVSGHDGDDLNGYRDYRGVLVVGAWRWLDDLRIGVATELDLDEAEPLLRTMRLQTMAVFFMFAFCLVVACGSFYSIQRIRANVGENQKLGQYRLERQIGEGGMGKVFLATHELLKRPTAIKLLKPEFIGQESIARFEREARLVSHLEHFNTIGIYDYGVSKEGVFYLVMEYVDGLTLSELIDLEKSISPARTVFLLRQVLCSLREAHQAGVVHRDLKPGNVMICTRGGDPDFVKVLDFGLVKPIDTTMSQEITATNMVAGTPQYLAPERLSDPETNDPRSDLFAWGAVAFYLLTGRNAVSGRSLGEILHSLVNVPPSRPSDHTNEQIPQALDELIFRCLSKDPADRPDSAEQMIAELDHLEGVSDWTPDLAETWWEKYRHLKTCE